MKKVLVLSGGGARGIIQLETLIRIEQEFRKPIYKIFDLIVGTSVGAITGGLLSTGKFSAAAYNILFLKLVEEIFHCPWYKILSMPKYKRDIFYQTMDTYFAPNFLMKDCKTKFVCTSVNLCDNKTHYFKSWEDKDGQLKLKDAIARSFAAPYFFGMLVDDVNKSLWIDGGSGVSNCPLDIAFVESIRQGWNSDTVEFTVIGTGQTVQKFSYEDGKNDNTIKQVLRFIDPSEGGLARLQSTMDVIDRLKAIDEVDKKMSMKYYDVRIQEEHDKLDKIKFINEYIEYGKKVDIFNS